MAKSSIKSNLLAFSISMIVCLFLAEMVLRWVTPKEEGANVHQLFCEHDPILGWRKKPNFSGRHITTEYNIFEEMNSEGIRGPEYPLEKDSGEYRILILGDSFSEGYTVEFEELFSEQLKSYLNEDCAGKYEVINGGTGGWSTDQELLFFEEVGVKYKPDLTVLLFCENDPWYNAQPNYWRGAKPQFIPSGDSLRLTNVPVPVEPSLSFFQKAKNWGLKNLQLFKYLKRAKDNLKYSSGQQAVPVEWEIYRKEEKLEMRKAWEVTEKILARLREKTESAGSELLVFYINEKVEIYEEEWERFIETYSLDENNFAQEIPRQKLAGICADLNIPFLDPTEEFLHIAQSDTSHSLYFKLDWHWNVYGHALVGEALAEEIGCPSEE